MGLSILLNIPTMGLLLSPVSLGFLLIPVAQYFHKYQQARIYLLLNLNFGVYAFSTALGPEAGVHFWFLLSATMPFAIFGLSERKLLMSSVLLPVGLMFFIWMTGFKYSPLPVITAEPGAHKTISEFMMAMSLITALSVVYYLTSQYSRSSEQMQKFLKQQIDNNELALNSSSIVTRADLNGKLIYANENFCKISGYSQSELLGKNHPLIDTNFHSTEFFKQMWDQISRKEIWKGEIHNQSREGIFYWFDTTIVPASDLDNEIQSYLFIHHDITLTKNSELRFKSIFEQGTAGFVFASLDGVVTDCNEPYAQFFESTREQMLGKRSRDINHPEDYEKNMVETRKLLSGEIKTLISERRYLKKDGSVAWYLVNATAVDIAGQPVYIAAVLQDLTEAKSLQASLVSSSSLAALGEMAAGVAHEINNPLAILIASSELLIKDVRNGADPEELVTRIQKVQGTAERIAKIVKGLRLFSRNSEKDPCEVVKVSEVVEMTLELCQEKISKCKVDLQIHVAKDLELYVRPTEISQVLMNLISNSTDAIAQLPKKWIEVTARQNNSKITISVTDSGGGIAKETAEKIMNPFFSTKEVGQGTGLGLSISKGIIEAHGGHFYYDPTSANTRFVIEIQASSSENKKVHKSAS